MRAWSEHGASASSSGGSVDGGPTDVATKAICGNCKNTVRIVEINGERVATDTELIRTVPKDGAKQLTWGRRLHAERCEKLKADAERAVRQEEMKRWTRDQKRTRNNALAGRSRGRARR